jgi:hypothetical protein
MSSARWGTGWFSSPNWIFDRNDLSKHAKLVFLYICRRLGPDGDAIPSISRIATDCSESDGSVKEALRELRNLGLLVVEPRTSASGDATSNRYRIGVGQPATHPPHVGGATGDPPVGQPATTKVEGPVEQEEPVKEDCSDPAPSVPVVAIPVEFNGLELYRADTNLCRKWPVLLPALIQAYPRGKDWIVAEVRKAHAWEVANSTKRKKDRPKFLAGWLARAQDKNDMSTPSVPPAHRPLTLEEKNRLYPKRRAPGEDMLEFHKRVPWNPCE